MPVYIVKISKYHLSSSRLISSEYTHIYPKILFLLVLLIYHFSIKNRFAFTDRYTCSATQKSGIYFCSCVAVLDAPLCVLFSGVKKNTFTSKNFAKHLRTDES